MIFITPSISPVVCDLCYINSGGTTYKNFLTDDKIIGMGNLYHSSCKAVDETIELFTDMKPRGTVESCSRKISKGRHVDSNLTR